MPLFTISSREWCEEEGIEVMDWPEDLIPNWECVKKLSTK